MKSKPAHKSLPFLGRIFLALASAVALVLVFAYGILPGRVAQGLVDKGLHPQPLVLDPGSSRVPFANVGFKSPDGLDLKGWWIPSEKKPAGTVVLSHGVFRNRDQMLSRAVFLHQAGYQVLLFDLRGHGESAPAPLSGGLTESRDFLGALAWLKGTDRLREPLAFYGLSLGAMAALRAAAQLPMNVAVIADSPLPNAESYVSKRTSAKWFLAFPGFFDRCLSAYNGRTGQALTVKDLDLKPVVEALGNRPVLYFVGEKDDLVSGDAMKDLFDRSPTHLKRLVYVPQAVHDKTYESFKVMYEKTVLEFLSGLKDHFKKQLAQDARERALTVRTITHRPVPKKH